MSRCGRWPFCRHCVLSVCQLFERSISSEQEKNICLFSIILHHFPLSSHWQLLILPKHFLHWQTWSQGYHPADHDEHEAIVGVQQKGWVEWYGQRQIKVVFAFFATCLTFTFDVQRFLEVILLIPNPKLKAVAFGFAEFNYYEVMGLSKGSDSLQTALKESNGFQHSDEGVDQMEIRKAYKVCQEGAFFFLELPKLRWASVGTGSEISSWQEPWLLGVWGPSEWFWWESCLKQCCRRGAERFGKISKAYAWPKGFF